MTISDINIFADKIAVLLGKRFTKIKSIDINNLSIKLSNNQTSEFNIAGVIPLLSQKIVRNLTINKIIWNDTTLHEISCSNIVKLKTSNISFKDNNKQKYLITTQLNGKDLGIFCKFQGYVLNIFYNLHQNRLFSQLLKNNNEICNMNGVIQNNKMNCIVYVPYIKQALKIDVYTKHNSILLDGYSDYIPGTSIHCAYDTETKQLCCNSLTIGTALRVMPFTISDTGQVSDINIMCQEGNVTIQGASLTTQTFSLGTWEFNNINIAQFQNTNAEQIRGTLNGHAVFKENAEFFDLSLDNIEYGILKLPPLQIKGTLSQNSLDVKCFYTILKQINQIHIKAHPDNWIVNSDTPFHIDGNGIFNLDQSLKQDKNQIIKGDLKYNFSISGCISQPLLKGTLALSNGIYINPLSGTYIKNGTIDMSINDKVLVINKIHAIDDLQSAGSLKGSGKIYYQNGEPYVDVNLKIDNMEVVSIPELKGRIFGDIQINGSLSKQIKITGNLYSNKAELNISNFVTMANYSIDIVDSLKEKPPVNPKPQYSLDIPIDIKFVFKPNLYIKGFGIKSWWDGGATVSGTIQDLKYDFTIKLNKGHMDVTGKKFTLKNGIISCSDKTNGNVNVDVSAMKTISSGIKVGAQFIQNEKNTDVVFFSKPYLSKNDILSYMLFEKPTSEISAGEALTLFTVMSKLSGKGTFNIIDKVKTVFGLDSIEIKKHEATDTGNPYTSLSIGKSIGKLKISIDQGTEKDTTKVIVDADIAKNTRMSVDLSGANNVGAGVFWHRRY